MATIASVADSRTATKAPPLPRFLSDHAEGGASAGETCRRNVHDPRTAALGQGVLRDVAAIDLSITLLGGAWP